MGGVASGFQFISYKVDRFHFDARQDTAYLSQGHVFDPQDVKISLAFRQPIFDKGNGIYLGGLEAHLAYPSNREGDQESYQFELTAGLEGVFQTKDREQFSPEVEQDLVKFQIPAILFPYLRAAITGFFASAGLGSFVFPLVNVREMARQTSRALEINVISSD
jgi:hypothetical protein